MKGLRSLRLPPAIPGLTGVLVLALTACQSAPEVPTYTAQRRDFVHSVSAEGILVSRRTTPILAPRELSQSVYLAWREADGLHVREGDLLARLDANELELRLQEGEADLLANSLTLRKTRIDAGVELRAIEVDRQVADLELSQAERSRKSDEDLFSRNEIIESRIDATLAGHRRENAVARQRIHGAVSEAEIQLLEIERRQQELTLDQARRGLEALEVRAPAEGILTWKRSWRGEIFEVGAQVFPGQQFAEIAGLDEMEAEVYVLEADAGGLEVGQEAQIVLEARPEEELQGTVRRVDAVAKPRFRGSPVQYFGVTVAFRPAGPEPLRPGQRLRATLFLERQAEALVVPRQAVFQGDDGAQVYVARGAAFERRSVELKTSSLGLAVIDGGLEEGEAVALEIPRGLAGEGGAGGPGATAPSTDTLPGADAG